MADPITSSGAPVDLANRDREPIHLLGAVQPFGFLIAVSTPDWFVQRVSSNVADWLKVAPADMPGGMHMEVILRLSDQTDEERRRAMQRQDLSRRTPARTASPGPSPPFQ